MRGPGPLFDTSVPRSDLKSRSLRGGFATLSSQGGILLLRIVSTAILARLLTPDDFGLIAMVVTLTAFATLFKDLGLSTATIQRADIRHEQVSNLFWVNGAAGAATMGAVMAAAPLLVLFYNEPRLQNITYLLSVNFLIGGFTIQHQALLSRKMRFGRIALIEWLAVLVSCVVALVLAWVWHGSERAPLALVGMSFAHAAFLLVGMWWSSAWMPGRWHRNVGTRPLLRFGAGVAGFNIVNYFARNADNILIAKVWGPEPLAFYSKAYQFLLLPIQQIRTPLVTIAVPALSALQHDPERYGRYVCRLFSLLAFVTMPLMACLAVNADLVVRCLLGEQWMDAVPIFRVLSLLAFIQPVAGLCGIVPLTRGHSKRLFHFGVINGLLLVCAFAVGIRWGAIGVAWSYMLVSYLILWPTWAFCLKDSPVTVRQCVGAVLHPATLAAIAGGLLFVARRYEGLWPRSPFWSLAVTSAVAGLLYIGLWAATARGRLFLKECSSYARVLINQQPEKATG